MRTISKRTYKSLKSKIDANQMAVREYLKTNKTNSIPCAISKTFPFAKYATNENRSKLEVYEFCNDIPQTYFLYINKEKREATTWTGEKLGNVIVYGRTYRSNFGDKRANITVEGINGKYYFGTYFVGAGDYARIKLCKNQ